MNERIAELYNQAIVIEDGGDYITGELDPEKFAELIIKECYENCKGQLMDKSLAEKAGLDYNDGVMDCAIGLKQHFGVEE